MVKGTVRKIERIQKKSGKGWYYRVRIDDNTYFVFRSSLIENVKEGDVVEYQVTTQGDWLTITGLVVKESKERSEQLYQTTALEKLRICAAHAISRLMSNPNYKSPITVNQLINDSRKLFDWLNLRPSQQKEIENMNQEFLETLFEIIVESEKVEGARDRIWNIIKSGEMMPSKAKEIAEKLAELKTEQKDNEEEAIEDDVPF